MMKLILAACISGLALVTLAGPVVADEGDKKTNDPVLKLKTLKEELDTTLIESNCNSSEKMYPAIHDFNKKFNVSPGDRKYYCGAIYSLIEALNKQIIQTNLAIENIENAENDFRLRNLENIYHCDYTQSQTPPNSKNKTLLIKLQNFSKYFRYGADGTSTLITLCEFSNSDNSSIDLASNTGALLSIQNDGILKKQSLAFKGAFGYNIAAKNLGGYASQLSIYAKIDDEKQATTVTTGILSQPTKKQVVYTQNILEYGLVYRGNTSTFIDWLIRSATERKWVRLDDGAKLKNNIFESFILIQPFYLKDHTRNSELYGANLRWTPITRYINAYDRALSSNINRENPSVIDRIYGGILADIRFYAAHFSQDGFTPLGEPVNIKVPAGTIEGNPLYLPNEDYGRVGGRGGGFAQVYAGQKPITFFLYYTDFTPVWGVRHEFGEVVSQLAYPLLNGVSVAGTYTNGRSENVAAREQSWSLALKFGGAQ